MKIKVIDLLNKIANGEKVPEKIKYKNCIFENRCIIDYWCKETETCLDELILMQNLNDEVEIIDEIEEKKIPENNFNYIYSCEDEHIMANFENIKTTLKDIIDYLKSKGE